jgi:CHAT domain-containing protein
MEHHSWVHLACHAVQDISGPTQSTFLSACQTAAGDEKLSEEAVHLVAGMLAAGYRSVITTMWFIMDDDTLPVAAEVYSHLVPGSEPDSTRAA